MRYLLAMVIGLLATTRAWAGLADVARYLPADSDIVISIDCEQLLRAEATRVLLGDHKVVRLLQDLEKEQVEKQKTKPSPPETFFAVELMERGKHITVSFQIFDASTALVEGAFDPARIAQEAREFAEKNKCEFTREKTGEKEIVRVGGYAFCVVNKGLLAISDSPPPTAKGGGFLSAAPGAAEKSLKTVVAHDENKTKSTLHKPLTGLIAQVPADVPLVALLAVAEPNNPQFVTTVRIDGASFQARLVGTYPTVAEAETGEKETRQGLESLIKELGDVAIRKAFQNAKVQRRENQVTEDVILPAGDLKPSLLKLLQF